MFANTDGEYIVNIIDDNNCVSTDTFILNILNGTTVAPIAEAGMTSELNCYDDEVSLNGTGSETGSGIVYEWSGPGIIGSTTQLMTDVNQPGLYTLVVTNNANGCSSTDQVDITQDIAEPTAVTNMPEMLDCNTSEVMLDGTGSSIGSQYTYQWTDILGNPLGSTISTEVSTIGLYTLTVLNTDNGCEADADVGVLENLDLPTLVDFIVTEPECYGDTDASITVGEITGGMEPFVFSIDGEPFSTDQFFQNISTGDHTITIQDINGCELEEVVNIFQPDEILFDIGLDQFKKLGDSIIITSETNVPYDRIDTILWSIPLPFDCDDPECLEIGFSTFTTLGINATIVDINGCSETDDIVINLDQRKDVYVPTAFSPNGDGDNDYFTIYVNEAQVTQIRNFRVYNRWGGVMFQSLALPINQETEGWDGSFNGKYVNPGVYIYDAEVDLIDGRTERVTGDITVHN